MRNEQPVETRAPRSSRRARRVVISAVILAMAVGGVAVVAVLPGRSREAPPKEVGLVDVEVMRIQPLAEMDETFNLHGQIEANRVVDVAAEVAGRIEKIHLAEGRPCTKGQPLIQLNTDILAAEMRRAKATAEFAQRELDRLMELRAREVATPFEVDQARSKAEAGKAALDLAQANLNRATILAPADGVLNRVPVEAGEYVSPGDKVGQIVEIDPVKVVVDVPERVIQHLRLGDEHTVILGFRGNGRRAGKTAPGRPADNERTGTITYIGELADQKTRTTRVELTVPNPEKNLPGSRIGRELRSGQIVQVELKLRTHANAIMIPLQAVIPLEKRKVVYVVEGGKAERRKVKLGWIKGYDVQVTGGLGAGDRLIIKGHQLVGPDQQVHVIRQTLSPGGEAPAARPIATQPAGGGARTPPHGTTQPRAPEAPEAKGTS
jgi:membrane fusion protein (multidrug efflux system)